MKSLTRTAQFDPKKLSASAREDLAKALYAVHQQIFEGPGLTEFERRIINPPSCVSSVQVSRNRDGEIVGYCAVHFFELRQHNTTIIVMRAQAGMLRAFRGRNRSMPFTLMKVLAYRLRHPLHPMFFFGAMIHPSSYLLCDKYISHIWPARGQSLSYPHLKLVERCIEAFRLPPVNPSNPRVVKVGIRTLDDDADQHYWSHCDKPAVRFFLEHNPDYQSGNGLVTLIPVSLPGMAVSAWRLVLDRVRRGVSRWRGRLQLAGG